jgi:hypothetical protein
MPWFRRFVAGPSTRRPCSKPSQNIRDLWLPKWHLDKFSPKNSEFPVNIIPHMFILVIVYVFLLPERRTGEHWEISEKQRSFGNRGKLDRKVLSFFQSYHCLFYLTNGQSHANRWSFKFPLHCSFYWDWTNSTNLEVLHYVWVCWHISDMEFGKQMGVAAAH